MSLSATFYVSPPTLLLQTLTNYTVGASLNMFEYVTSTMSDISY